MLNRVKHTGRKNLNTITIKYYWNRDKDKTLATNYSLANIVGCGGFDTELAR